MQSPITFLYEAFAREPQSQREVVRLENEDRRILLQELVKYVDYDIVDLSLGSLSPLHVSAIRAKTRWRWSQYEFILYVKQRYQVFRMLPRTLLPRSLTTTSTRTEVHRRGSSR